jgi:hypothetical protein
MVLTYDAYNETLKEQEKQKLEMDKISKIVERIESLEDKILSSS